MWGKVLFVVTTLTWLPSAPCLATAKNEHDVPEVSIGERLFLETRFAQAYYASPGTADPALAQTLTTTEPLRGPFAGQTMNCRACHMVDEHKDKNHGGMRSYADFAHHSPIPDRRDGNHRTTRNSMALVGIMTPGDNALFHFDGEFNSMEDLVRATFTGRNYGWLPDESEQAVKHLASIIRSDDGTGALAKEFGGSYKKILTGRAKDIPAKFRLPADYRIDVASASDKQLFNRVAKLVSAYVNDLTFKTDKNGNSVASPYDQFLKINNLPARPEKGESDAIYSQRLLTAIDSLTSPKFVTSKNGKFETHKQEFVFGKQELLGMKLFFAKAEKGKQGGNCVSCHTAPHFSDFSFHNNGLTQFNYDRQHEFEAFNKVDIPGLQQRNKAYDQHLPATAKHPRASSRFRSHANIDKPGYMDLGLWNIFANPDMPAPQDKLKKRICAQAMSNGIKNCTNENLLPLTIASFKTPVLRDLGHSAPYMHSGEFTNLKEAVAFYMTTSLLAQQGQLRNTDIRMKSIRIAPNDFDSLVAFLQSLNEDYD